MLQPSKVYTVLLTISFVKLSSANTRCVPLSSDYFQWLNADGSLALRNVLGAKYFQYDSSQSPNDEAIHNVPLVSCMSITTQGGTSSCFLEKFKDLEDDDCCGSNCEGAWHQLIQWPACRFCEDDNSLICDSADVYEVPPSSDLPTSSFSLYKLSGQGLIYLSPGSFSDLYIYQLKIQNSNLSFISPDVFSGARSVISLHLTNNSINQISQAASLFEPLRGLKVLDLQNNNIQEFLSFRPANLQSLEYFSLRGDELHNLDIYFLQNSPLKVLDLSRGTLSESLEHMEEAGWSLLPNTLTTVDLSYNNVNTKSIGKLMKNLIGKDITTVNLGYLSSSATHIFNSLCPIKHSLQYLSLEGNDMSNALSLDQIIHCEAFTRLVELNMKNCSLVYLNNVTIFQTFPNLKALSLSYNPIFNFKPAILAFSPLLAYLDLSFTNIDGMQPLSFETIVPNLSILDLSYASMYLDASTYIYFFNSFPNLQKLSICGGSIYVEGKPEYLKSLCNLKYLDLSGVSATSSDSFYNLFLTEQNSSLTELQYTQNNFNNADTSLAFSSLTSLKTLNLSNNIIRDMSGNIIGSSLENLILSQNFISTWYSSVMHDGSCLKSLDISKNQITYVSDSMLKDFYKLNSLNLNSNPLMCHNKVVAMVCAGVKNKPQNPTIVSWQHYQCYDLFSNSYRLFAEPKECDEYYEEVSTTATTDNKKTVSTTKSSTIKNMTSTSTGTSQTSFPLKPTKIPSYSTNSSKTYYLLIGLVMLAAVVTITGTFIYRRWWSIKCYIHGYWSFKKSQLLRKYGEQLIKPEVQYDVFVSYSDVNRSWILDHLIPNLEADGDISLCFHERDFQVGLSILENIIDCMDRSHALLLVVSSAFVRSKWCQFEMHLAQYRLIETFRDKLVLVLLEDIPRKARPKVLHHLMMTKTYLIWPTPPCKEDAVELFWKRLRRALKPSGNIFNV